MDAQSQRCDENGEKGIVPAPVPERMRRCVASGKKY